MLKLKQGDFVFPKHCLTSTEQIWCVLVPGDQALQDKGLHWDCHFPSNLSRCTRISARKSKSLCGEDERHDVLKMGISFIVW